jgi:N-methylhydantoinase A
MYAFGGAGPVHAFRVAEILGCPEVIVPYGAGVGSTIGFLVAPVSFDFVRSYVCHLESADWDQINGRFTEMEAEGTRILGAAGVSEDEIVFERSAELRYAGQGHDVRVAIPSGQLSAASRSEIEQTFADEYLRLYGRTPSGNPVEAMTWRVIAQPTTAPAEISFASSMAGATGSPQPGSRAIYLPGERAMVEVPVYSRYKLAPGFTVDGPCVIEERESTTIVGERATVETDDQLNLVITLTKR